MQETPANLGNTQPLNRDDAGEASSRLVGAWRLVAIDVADRPAQAVEGLIIYSADGYMSAQIMSPGAGESTDETESAQITHHAYFGTWSVDAAASAVTHHRIANTTPNAPADVVRQYRFISDDVLVLTPLNHSGIQLTFQRPGTSPSG